MKIAEPVHLEGHFVGSPIKRNQCEKMNDDQWLSAIIRYGTEDERKRGSGFIDGGARQLAGELQELTKKEPERFSKLSLTIPDTAHSSYLEHILWGLAEAEAPSDKMLIQVVKRVHRHPEKPFGSGIARLIERHPHIASNPEIIEILIWYALNGEAKEDEASEKQSLERETISIDTLVQRGKILHVRGTNGDRGRAWEALSSVLWEVEGAEIAIWKLLDIVLEKENLVSVRCSMMKVLAPLFNKNKERFSAAIRKLIVLPQNQPRKMDTLRLSPLITHTGISLFPYIFYWLPELADDLTAELLNNGDEIQQLIGAWLIFYENFRNDVYVEKANELVIKSVDHRRLLSGVTADAIGWAENKIRAEDLLKAFFFDEDKQVREHAADVFRNVKSEEVEQLRELAAIFIKSPAFSDSGSKVLYMLENATCDVLDLVLDATERLIADMVDVNNRQGRQGADLYHLQDLLKREYASSEGSAEARRKILDMIDCLLFHDIQGVESIVSTHDRW